MRLGKLIHILSLLALFIVVPSFSQESTQKTQYSVVIDESVLQEISDTYRGNPDRAKDFIPQGDGTVIDKRTGLQWMRCSLGQSWTGTTCEGKGKRYLWEVAKGMRINLAGYDDWRLPNIWELETLVYCDSGTFMSRSSNKGYLNECTGDFKSPTIVKKAFPNSEYNYWSSTILDKGSYASGYENFGNRIPEVSFYLGTVNFYYSKGHSFYVRLVRTPQ